MPQREQLNISVDKQHRYYLMIFLCEIQGVYLEVIINAQMLFILHISLQVM
jgi:hypothetical protein